MAKDPAMLWYWSDWHSGTALLSRFLKGCYMDILHAQFNHGRLSLEEIKTCLGPDFGQSWPALQKKFKSDQSGLFFSERLEYEKTRRQNFVESRRVNKAKKSYDETHDEHMMPHMENENRNETLNGKVRKGVQGENHRKTKFLTNQRWKEEFCQAKNLQMPQLETLMKDFVSDCDLKGQYIDSYQKYFTNLFNKKQENGTGTHQQSNSNGSQKLGTSAARIDKASKWGS